MADFTLEPDEPDLDRPDRRRPVRLVASGLAPTAEVPTPARPHREPPPCYAPCEACGMLVLSGRTPAGQRVADDEDDLDDAPTFEAEFSEGRPPATDQQSV